MRTLHSLFQQGHSWHTKKQANKVTDTQILNMVISIAMASLTILPEHRVIPDILCVCVSIYSVIASIWFVVSKVFPYSNGIACSDNLPQSLCCLCVLSIYGVHIIPNILFFFNTNTKYIITQPL